MTIEHIMGRMSFRNNFQKKDCEFYLRNKGIAVHEKILKYLDKDFFDKETLCPWEKVSSLLRYDKRLRDKIYIYLATLEEYLRASISNKYNDSPFQDFWYNGYTKRAKIRSRIENGEQVSDVLENLDFGDLLCQVLRLPNQDLVAIFNDLSDIEKNLEAVRRLRNVVSHHVFLLSTSFLPCVVNGIEDITLTHNIRNLRQLLPKEYRYGKNGRGGITADINNCLLTITKNNNQTQYINEFDIDEKHRITLDFSL